MEDLLKDIQNIYKDAYMMWGCVRIDINKKVYLVADYDDFYGVKIWNDDLTHDQVFKAKDKKELMEKLKELK